MLEVKALRKSYPGVVAVDSVSFHAAPGETVGLLGPNGAGKTTTVSIIAGLLRADSGEVLIEGRALRGDADPLKHKIGLVPQDLALYDELSAHNNLALFGALYNITGTPLQRAMADALELVGLADRVRDKVSSFSGGMKRRLNLAAALLHDPQILLLDEPTVGVDPQSRYAIFDHGKVVANDTLAGLYRLLPVTNLLSIELETSDNGLGLDGLRRLPEVESAELAGGVLKVGLRNLAGGTPRVLDWLAAEGRGWQHVASERPDLESVFLSLTGRSLRDR